MTHAYDEIYLNDAMSNLGDMFDYAVNDCGLAPDSFFSDFIASGVAGFFEKGNPKYVAGLSGPELAREVSRRTTGAVLTAEASEETDKSPEYWMGWILAYYQWLTAHRFIDLHNRGLTVGRILSMYPTLHEADVSKFAEVADEIIRKNRLAAESSLKRIRTAAGFTQKALSERSGVSLRMIQLYEQKRQDIGKAEAQTLISLARTLGCEMQDLLD